MNEDVSSPPSKVNKSPISRLMYYLYSIKQILPEKIKPEFVKYESYTELSKEESRELCEIAKAYGPEVVNNKIIFESNELCAKNDHQYYNIPDVANQLNVNENVQIGSESFHITKILAYNQQWIQKFFYGPYNQITKKVTPKQHKQKKPNPALDDIEDPAITQHCSWLRIISLSLVSLIFIVLIVVCAFAFYMYQNVNSDDHKTARRLLDGIAAVAILTIAFYLIGLTMKYCRRKCLKRTFYILCLVLMILEIVLCAILMKKVEDIDEVNGFRIPLLVLVIVVLVLYMIELLFVVFRQKCSDGYANEPYSFCCCCRSKYV